MNKGIAILPTILAITAIIVEISIIIWISSYYINMIIRLTRLSNSALYAAESGINDALLKLTRNKDLNVLYSLPIDSGKTVDVSIQKNGDKATIAATGTSNFVSKTIQAIVNISTSDFQTTLESWKEI